MASLLKKHFQNLETEPVRDETLMRFEDAGPDSDSDSGLEDLFSGSPGWAEDA